MWEFRLRLNQRKTISVPWFIVFCVFQIVLGSSILSISARHINHHEPVRDNGDVINAPGPAEALEDFPSSFRRNLVRKNLQPRQNQPNLNHHYSYSSSPSLSSSSSSGQMQNHNQNQNQVHPQEPGSSSRQHNFFGGDASQGSDDDGQPDEDQHSYHERYIQTTKDRNPNQGNQFEDQAGNYAVDAEGEADLGRHSLVNSYFDNEYSLRMLHSMECITPTKSKGYCSTLRSCVPSLFTSDGELEAPALAELIAFSIGYCTMDVTGGSNVLMKRSGNRFSSVANRIICCPGSAPNSGMVSAEESVEKFNDFLSGKGPQVSNFDDMEHKQPLSTSAFVSTSNSQKINPNSQTVLGSQVAPEMAEEQFQDHKHQEPSIVSDETLSVPVPPYNDAVETPTSQKIKSKPQAVSGTSSENHNAPEMSEEHFQDHQHQEPSIVSDETLSVQVHKTPSSQKMKPKPQAVSGSHSESQFAPEAPEEHFHDHKHQEPSIVSDETLSLPVPTYNDGDKPATQQESIETAEVSSSEMASSPGQNDEKISTIPIEAFIPPEKFDTYDPHTNKFSDQLLTNLDGSGNENSNANVGFGASVGAGSSFSTFETNGEPSLVNIKSSESSPDTSNNPTSAEIDMVEKVQSDQSDQSENATIVKISPEPVKGANGKFTLENGVIIEKATSETPRPKPNPAFQTQIGETTVNIIKTEATIDSNPVLIKPPNKLPSENNQLSPTNNDEELNAEVVQVPTFSAKIPSNSAPSPAEDKHEITHSNSNPDDDSQEHVDHNDAMEDEDPSVGSGSYDLVPTTTFKSQSSQNNNIEVASPSASSEDLLPTTIRYFDSHNENLYHGDNDVSQTQQIPSSTFQSVPELPAGINGEGVTHLPPSENEEISTLGGESEGQNVKVPANTVQFDSNTQVQHDEILSQAQKQPLSSSDFLSTPNSEKMNPNPQKVSESHVAPEMSEEPFQDHKHQEPSIVSDETLSVPVPPYNDAVKTSTSQKVQIGDTLVTFKPLKDNEIKNVSNLPDRTPDGSILNHLPNVNEKRPDSQEAFPGSSMEHQEHGNQNQLFLGKDPSSYELQSVDDSAEAPAHFSSIAGQRPVPGVQRPILSHIPLFQGAAAKVPPQAHEDDSMESEHNPPYPVSQGGWSIGQLYQESSNKTGVITPDKESMKPEMNDESGHSDDQLSQGHDDEAQPGQNPNPEPLLHESNSDSDTSASSESQSQSESVESSETPVEQDANMPIELHNVENGSISENNPPALTNETSNIPEINSPGVNGFAGSEETVLVQSDPSISYDHYSETGSSASPPGEIPQFTSPTVPAIVISSEVATSPTPVTTDSYSTSTVPVTEQSTTTTTRPYVPLSSEIGGLSLQENHESGAQPEYQILSACATQDYYRSLEQDSLRQYPFLATIVGGSRPFCSGSLVTDRHILTAAHFLSNITVADVFHMRVHVGYRTGFSGQTEGPFAVRKVLKVIRHKGFSFDKLTNDIAILVLDRPIRFSEDVHPVCLSNTPDLYSNGAAEAFETGWMEDPLMQKISPMHPFVDPHILKYFTFGYKNVTWALQEASTRIRTNDECQANYGFLEKSGISITESMVCAASNSESKSCSFKGNSGAPLYISNDGKPIQVGLVSWGIGCGHFPAVYTSVAQFIPWIEKVVYRTS